MSSAPDLPELDALGLRTFALTVGGIFAVLFGLMLPWLLDGGFPVWPWIIFAVLGIWGLIAPESLRRVYRLWMRFGFLVHSIMSPLILSLVFFVVITPVAFAMKIIGRDSMNRRFDKGLESYRVTRSKAPREKLEKPF